MIFVNYLTLIHRQKKASAWRLFEKESELWVLSALSAIKDKANNADQAFALVTATKKRFSQALEYFCHKNVLSQK